MIAAANFIRTFGGTGDSITAPTGGFITGNNIYRIEYTATNSYYDTGTTSTNYNSMPSGNTNIIFPVSIDRNIEATGTNYVTVRFSDGTNYAVSDFELRQSNYPFWNLVDSKVQARQKFKTQHRANPSLRGNPSFTGTLSPAEVNALQLLRQLVSPENFRKYLKYGFVTVKGMSGLIYNVYRSRNTIVYDDQTEVASLCVHIKDRKAPPTDEVIAKVLMCECEEHEIWKRSNRSFRNKTSKVTSLGLDKLPRAA